jgi:hypothetical protein
MDGISWTHATRSLSIYRRLELPAVVPQHKTKTRNPAEDSQRVQLRNNYEARRVLLFVREQLWKLRHLLASDCYNVCRMTDDEVLDCAATMLVRGEWVLFERRSTGTRNQSLASYPAAPSTGIAPTNLLSPRQPPSRNAGSIAPPMEVAEETFDQDAQAATLRLAAAHGIPFCEICERSKRGRSKASRAGVAA